MTWKTCKITTLCFQEPVCLTEVHSTKATIYPDPVGLHWSAIIASESTTPSMVHLGHRNTILVHTYCTPCFVHMR